MPKNKQLVIHDDTSFKQFVIPGLTEPAPYLIWGNPAFFWIPAGVYPDGNRGRNDRTLRRLMLLRILNYLIIYGFLSMMVATPCPPPTQALARP
jgi:hypothetical protein